MLQNSLKGASRKIEWCFDGVLSGFHLKEVHWLFKGSFKDVSKKFSGCFKGSSERPLRGIQGSFKGI